MGMRRVLVIGCSAGGKSTVARALGKVLGIEVIHLDKVLWKPGCRLRDSTEEPQAVRDLLNRPAWIMDGNYTVSLPMRLAAADTIVVIDFSRLRCLLRALKRLLQFRGRTRPDMGANCPEALNLDFLRWIWSYPRRERPELVRQIETHADHAQVIYLHNPADVERWLEQVRREAAENERNHSGASHAVR